jgi:hypothetical protein
MRVTIPVMAAGFGLVGLAGCVGADTYPTNAYRPGPTTTTTTTVVRDGYGNPISTAEAVRDANGNPVSATAPGTYQYAPGYYQNAPGYPPPSYRRY